MNIGNLFEKKWANFLFNAGFWVYILPISTGQPCDILGIRNNIAYLYECKHCEKDIFNCNRIEPNQRTSAEFYRNLGNTNYYLVVQYKSGIKLYHFRDIETKKTLNFKDNLGEFVKKI